MKKSNFILLIFIAATALAISFLIQRRAGAALRQNERSLQQQQDAIARASEENQRLSNRVAQAAGVKSHAADYTAELAQLQANAAALRAQQIQLSNRLWSSRVSVGERLIAGENYDLTNHNNTIHSAIPGVPKEPGKINDACTFAVAMQRYACEHDGVFPLSIDQVTPYLPRQEKKSGFWETPVSGTNDFEIVYQGGTNELANIPLRRIALIRERQRWLTPDGKWARTYGFAEGHAEIVTSDDNFQSWDALHIIPLSATP